MIYLRKYHTPLIEGQYRASIKVPGNGGTQYGYGHTAEEAIHNLKQVPAILDKLLEDVINVSTPPEECWKRQFFPTVVKFTVGERPKRTLWQWLRSLIQ